MPQCYNCRKPLRADDLFCCQCGCKLTGLELKLMADGASLDDCLIYRQKVPSELDVVITNRELYPVYIHGWSCNKHLKMPPPPSPSEALLPGDTLKASLTIDVDSLKDNESHASIEVRFDANPATVGFMDNDFEGSTDDFELPESGNESSEGLNNEAAEEIQHESIVVTFLPVPTLVSDGPEYYNLLLDGVDNENCEINLSASSGELTITEIKSDQEWLKSYCANLPQRLNSASQVKLKVSLVVDEEMLLEIGDHKRDLYSRLLIFSEELEQPKEVKLHFKAKYPPILHANINQGENQLTVLSGRKKHFDVHLENLGDSALEISAIDVLKGPGSITIDNLPLVVEPGQKRTAQLKIDVSDPQKYSPDSIRIEELELLFRCNSEPPEISKQCLISIRPARDAGTPVVLDFGTTATVVCTLNPRTFAPEIHHMGDLVGTDAAGKKYLDSCVLYRNGRNDYQVGALAKQFSSKGSQENYFTSFKRDLGTETIYPLFFDQVVKQVTAEEVTEDFLRKILETIPDKIGGLIGIFVATYPAKFNIKQREALLGVLRKVLPNAQIEMWPEPIAAGLYYILEHEEHDSYDLLVYDFGGGTTDVTLIRVKQKTEDGERTITPTIMGITGNARLGGEDVTSEIRSKTWSSVEEAALKQHNDKNTEKLLKVPNKVEARLSRTERMAALVNSLKIYELSERWKIFRSRFDEDHPDWKEATLQDLAAALPDDNSFQLEYEKEYEIAKSGPFEYLDLGSTRRSIPNVRFRFNREYVHNAHREPIENSIKNALLMYTKQTNGSSSNEAGLPLVIFPVGRSAQLPLVKELIEEHAKKSDITGFSIHSPDDMKDCVAKGAARLMSIVKSPGRIRIKMDKLAVSTSRYGFIEMSESGKPVFIEVIPNCAPLHTDEGGVVQHKSSCFLGTTDRIELEAVEFQEFSDQFTENEEHRKVGEYTISRDELIEGGVNPDELRQTIVIFELNTDQNLVVKFEIQGKQFELTQV